MKFKTIFLGIALLSALFASAAVAETNGWNVRFVRFAGGSVEMTYAGTWIDFNDSNNNSYTWRETARDDWSVYLRDDSRDMNMQIDLHRNVISLAWPDHPMQDWAPIVEKTDRMNGRQVTQVAIPGGGRFAIDGGNWHEYDAAGNRTATFRETGRDAWSVYLRDDGRQMDMQIDMHRMMISLAWPGHAMADQYPIVDAY